MTQSTAAEAPPPDPAPLPYDEIGGTPAVRALVERFYDLMEQDPRFAQLRAIHAWLGGPRDWFTQHPGTCIMSAHRQIGFGAVETQQWTQAMAQALADTGVDEALADKMNAAFSRMGQAMRGD